MLRKTGPIEEILLGIIDLPKPVPGDGQILIRVSACGLCRTDLHVIEGELSPIRLPLIPGHQVVGWVEAAGKGVSSVREGDRVGVAWLHSTCGVCRYCLGGQENLCDHPEFTGWTVDGGYAEYMVADSRFVYAIPAEFDDDHAAPLLCAGIIGFRSLRLAGINPGSKGKVLGIYGFGNAAHIAIQIANYWGVEVLAMTRDVRHRQLALDLGASWAGGANERPPQLLDSAIIFAPAGDLVPASLQAVRKGGCVTLGGIHMSCIPPLDHSLLYGERVLRSVANNTRADGNEFLSAAAEIPIKPRVSVFDLEDTAKALYQLKNDALEGAGVIRVAAR